jgi:Ca2+-binding RTX toxin-like protein
MIRRTLIVTGLALSILPATAAPGFAAGNAVTPGKAGRVSRAIGVADLKPAACTNGTPVNLVTGSGVITGTNQNDLVLGGTALDTIDGRQQNDCILGGAGDDVIDGFNGTDVCIGGPGTDVFVRCETAIQ